jgi:uncharacterized protein YndB with AHSA1/START domain
MWPKGPSFNGMTDLVLERRIGGRFFERYADGMEYEIGRVIEYEPPARVGFTWRAPSWDRATQVHVRFTPKAPAPASNLSMGLGGSREYPRNQEELRQGMGFHTGQLSITRGLHGLNERIRRRSQKTADLLSIPAWGFRLIGKRCCCHGKSHANTKNRMRPQFQPLDRSGDLVLVAGLS